jgi:two-component system, cell cycle sensor histidine kinase and response regulator CckA
VNATFLYVLRMASARTLLIVEDDPMVREVTALTLETEGYAILVAGDGKEALEILAQNPSVDLLLTDVIMPGMSGFVLAEHAKRLRPSLPVLYVSGYADEGMKNDSGVGLDEIIRKPFRAPQLTAEIERALGQPQGEGG